MKKIGLICAIALAGMSLAACGSQSSKKANSSSKTSSSKVVKHHKHKKQNKKKQSTSSSNADSTSSEKASTSSSNLQNQQAQQGSSSDKASSNNQTEDALTIHFRDTGSGAGEVAYQYQTHGPNDYAAQSSADSAAESLLDQGVNGRVNW